MSHMHDVFYMSAKIHTENSILIQENLHYTKCPKNLHLMDEHKK